MDAYPKVRVKDAPGYDDFEGWLLLESSEDWPVSVVGFERDGKRDAVAIPNACITLLENSTPIEMPVSEEDLHLAMSELYNSGHFELVAPDGTRVRLVDKDREQGDECNECGHRIPVVDGGDLANQHHAESCSLYDAANK